MSAVEQSSDHSEGKKRGLSPIYLNDLFGNPAIVYPRQRQRKRIVFGWYGGKFNHLDWLLPLIAGMPSLL